MDAVCKLVAHEDQRSGQVYRTVLLTTAPRLVEFVYPLLVEFVYPL